MRRLGKSGAFQHQLQVKFPVLQLTLVLLLCCKSRAQEAADGVPPWEVTKFTPSHATFYGGPNGTGTMGGACGYGNLTLRGYGLQTAALSDTLLNNGTSCGACFQIKCDFNSTGHSKKWCYPDAAPINITATNRCPPNDERDTNNGGWCNPPRTHFDLAQPMFESLANTVAGIIPIVYKRVPCVKQGGIKFYLGGNEWFNLVLVFNVGGAGSVINMSMKGDQTNWFVMKRNWGQNWELKEDLKGQRLSFKLTTSNNHTKIMYNVTPGNWTNGETYEGNTNFR